MLNGNKVFTNRSLLLLLYLRFSSKGGLHAVPCCKIFVDKALQSIKVLHGTDVSSLQVPACSVTAKQHQ